MTDPNPATDPGLLDPPPGGLDTSAEAGGGRPNPSAPDFSCPPISQNAPQGDVDAKLTPSPSQGIPVESHPLASQLQFDRPAPVVLEMPVKWNGEPTKAALKLLALEARAPSWDQDAAVGVLGLMADDGLTLTAACKAVGVRRSAVLAWKRLVPAFAELLSEAERGLGGFQRDKAVAELDGGAEPSAVQARMKLAGMYDRALSGSGGESGGGGVTVQVVQFGGGMQVATRVGGEHG